MLNIKESLIFKPITYFFLIGSIALFAPTAIARNCPYLIAPEFNGELAYCYDRTVSTSGSLDAQIASMGGSVSTTRTYCVYEDAGGYGREATNKTETVTKTTANQC